MEEDDIDNETIQARVNASLAYVNDLVSSWVKPHNKPSSHKDVEKEIEELMRRPPRLGVGAQPPESSGREGMRLKGMLVGKKKRSRGDDREAVKVPSDDEDESRAGAIKQKTKPDPLEFGAKKKRKMGDHAITTPHKQPGTIFDRPGDMHVNEMEVQPPVIADSSLHKSHKKKRRKKDKQDETVQLGMVQTASTTDFQPDATVKTVPTPQTKHSSLTAGNSVQRNAFGGTSFSRTDLSSVLNLVGPPSDLIDTSSPSPKKKRKKRKKKKHSGEHISGSVSEPML